MADYIQARPWVVHTPAVMYLWRRHRRTPADPHYENGLHWYESFPIIAYVYNYPNSSRPQGYVKVDGTILSHEMADEVKLISVPSHLGVA